jgi:hypothetical protein
MKWSQALCTSILVDGLCAHRPVGLTSPLRIELEGEEIVVTRPGTTLLLAYSKSSELPQLALTRSCIKPNITSPGISDFRIDAFEAATEKARELGWIV